MSPAGSRRGSRTARFPVALTALASCVVLAACGPIIVVSDGAPGGAAGSGAELSQDTVRGTIAVVGAEPLTTVVIDAGPSRMPVEGEAVETLRTVSGLEVRLEGRREGRAYVAEAFRVRAADGVPAADGMLELSGDSVFLTTPEGERLFYTPVPSALRAWVGDRVWIAGTVGGEPQAWGRIEDL